MKTLLQLLLVSLTIWGCNSGPQQKPEVDQVHLQHQDSLRLDSMGRAYNTLGGMDFDRGDYEKALKNYLLALDAYEKVNNPGCIAAVKINLGNISFGSKNYERALSYYTEAKEVVLNLLKDTANTLTNKRRLSTLYNNIGLVHKNEGGVENAFDNYFKGLKLAEEIGNKVKIAEVCNNLGNMLEKNGQYKEALDYYRKSFRFYSEIGNKNGMATVLANIANIRAKKGEYESALENFDEALAMTKEIGDKRVEMEIYERLAQLNMKLSVRKAPGKKLKTADRKLSSMRLSQELLVCSYLF